jgi:hypothetical protein
MLYGHNTGLYVPVSLGVEFLSHGIRVYKAHPTADWDKETVPINGEYIAGDRLADFPYEIGMKVLPRGWREMWEVEGIYS